MGIGLEGKSEQEQMAHVLITVPGDIDPFDRMRNRSP